MAFLSSFTPQEQKNYPSVVALGARVRSHLDMLEWLQGDLQRYLPHDIMMAAWGDFQAEKCTIHYDIISAVENVRTHNLTEDQFKPVLLKQFMRWQEMGRSPFVFNADKTHVQKDVLNMERLLGKGVYTIGSVLVHGICDKRFKNDCLYLVFRANTYFTEPERDVIAALLPTIDATLRQVDLLDRQVNIFLPAAHASQLLTQQGLSKREHEILQWVTIGKTNSEIGRILNISEYTVKNHMKRIFKKMGVSNRAQAVGKKNGLRIQT